MGRPSGEVRGQKQKQKERERERGRMGSGRMSVMHHSLAWYLLSPDTCKQAMAAYLCMQSQLSPEDRDVNVPMRESALGKAQ